MHFRHGCAHGKTRSERCCGPKVLVDLIGTFESETQSALLDINQTLPEYENYVLDLIEVAKTPVGSWRSVGETETIVPVLTTFWPFW